MRWVALAVTALSLGFAVGVAAFRPTPPPYVWTDAWSGKQYVVNPAGGIWPRMNDQGKHQDQWEQPR